MKISVVIPAYNEEKLIAASLESVKTAFLPFPAVDYETIVCDNNSKDGTGAIALAAGAMVVSEPVNQISRARNKGAGSASGDWLIFIDADSVLSGGTLGQTLAAIDSGRFAGGGALVGFDRVPHSLGKFMLNLWNFISRIFKLAAGSYLFCRADAFREIGGFSTELYAAEELLLSHKLKKWGAIRGLGFVILPGPHVSSGRKLFMYTRTELVIMMFKFMLAPFRALRDPARLKIFYGGRR